MIILIIILKIKLSSIDNIIIIIIIDTPKITNQLVITSYYFPRANIHKCQQFFLDIFAYFAVQTDIYMHLLRS